MRSQVMSKADDLATVSNQGLLNYCTPTTTYWASGVGTTCSKDSTSEVAARSATHQGLARECSGAVRRRNSPVA